MTHEPTCQHCGTTTNHVQVCTSCGELACNECMHTSRKLPGAVNAHCVGDRAIQLHMNDGGPNPLNRPERCTDSAHEAERQATGHGPRYCAACKAWDEYHVAPVQHAVAFRNIAEWLRSVAATLDNLAEDQLEDGEHGTGLRVDASNEALVMSRSELREITLAGNAMAERLGVMPEFHMNAYETAARVGAYQF